MDADPTEAIMHAQAGANPVALRGLSLQVTCGVVVWANLTVDIDLGATVAEARFSVPGA